MQILQYFARAQHLRLESGERAGGRASERIRLAPALGPIVSSAGQLARADLRATVAKALRCGRLSAGPLAKWTN